MLRARRAALVLAVLAAGCSGGGRTDKPVAATMPPATTPPPPIAPVTTLATAPVTTQVAPVTTMAQHQAPSLELDVEVPGWTQGAVFIALNQSVNNKAPWTPDAFMLRRDAQGRYVGSLPFPQGTQVEFKVTRGVWSRVEKGPLGTEVRNRAVTIGSGPTLARAHVFHWADDRILPPPGPLQDLNSFTPRSLGTARKVFAYLPPGYDDPANAQRRYPVLYVLDGQNMFDRARSATGVVWGLDVAARNHALAGRTAFIAVAIDNTPARIDEYTPSRDPRYGGGRLHDLAAFVFNELKPAIDHAYRTKPGPEDTGVMGSSLGGLASFHLAWTNPHLVRRVGAVSPSFWWNNEETRAMVRTATQKPTFRLWMDMGTAEGSNPQATLATTRNVADALRNLGFRDNQDLRYLEVPGGRHDEGSWAARLPEILAWLFP